MADGPILELVVGLSNPSTRAQSVEALASKLGVDSVLLFVRDPALGMLLPAAGLPQTVRGGRTWRAFLVGCPETGRHAGEVEFPPNTHRSALALLFNGTAVLLIGGHPMESEIADVERLLPLVAAMLAAEQHAVLARAEARAAKDAADRAQALATALEIARSDAAALNAELHGEQRRKDEFLAMLGHELRNPLSPLVTSIGILRMRGAGATIPERIVDVMARQTAQLSRLVDDLLDVSRVSRGRIELKREPLLLSDVLRDALEESWELLDGARQHVTLSHIAEPIVVNGDRSRLIQVFGNLLNNAAKYTDPGGRIVIRVLRDAQNAIVRVEDTGIGISEEMLPHIFDLFTQDSAALGRAQGGLGIGLTLVRALIELHGGRVTAESRGAGQGSTFSVSLPRVAAVKPARDPAPLTNSSAAGVKPLRVLVVDDNRDAADALAGLLRLKGHHVDVAYDGSAAIELSANSDADLFLLDIGLPEVDGYEVARRLRPTAKGGARFVALTGYGTDEGKRRSREAGFDAHIVKPVSTETLDWLIGSAGGANSDIGETQ